MATLTYEGNGVFTTEDGQRLTATDNTINGLIASGNGSLAQELSTADRIVSNAGQFGVTSGTKFIDGRLSDQGLAGPAAQVSPYVPGVGDPATETITTLSDGTVKVDTLLADATTEDLTLVDPDTAPEFNIEAGTESVVGAATGAATGDPFDLSGGILVNGKESDWIPPDHWDDWRVRLHISSGLKEFYNADNPGILTPLRDTDGIIFPYTPTISIQYSANYENYDLVHSNYRGYFYKNSMVQNLQLTATFTAQDTAEANYMLAALHFLRSCTKMFYGQDFNRGMPPPVVFLSGLGEYNFNAHPCVITQVNYNLPNDVDYIPAGLPTNSSPSDRATPARKANTGHQSWDSKISRLLGTGLKEGAERKQPTSMNSQTMTPDDLEGSIVYQGKTWVPTKMDIDFTMLPIQTRTQVSNKFSLTKYANGDLLKRGFW